MAILRKDALFVLSQHNSKVNSERMLATWVCTLLRFKNYALQLALSAYIFSLHVPACASFIPPSRLGFTASGLCRSKVRRSRLRKSTTVRILVFLLGMCSDS